MAKASWIRIPLATLPLALALSGCASKPSSQGDAADGEPAGPDAVGILSFFPNADQGVVVRKVQWGQAVTAENPGADCELKLRKQGPPANLFSCVMKKDGEAPVVLTLHETVDAAQSSRRLSKITVDGKGEATLARWTKDLEASEYAEVKGGRKGRRVFRSGDGKSEAQIVWAAQAGAVTVIVGPAAGGGKSAPVQADKPAQ